MAGLIAPEVTHILDEVFTLCRIPFVTDFLFTPDPVADITILTAPVQTEHAIAARITVSGTEASSQFAHIFDFACDFYFTSVPAFSVGPITVGFCTQEPARDATQDSLNTLPSACERVQCNRYVRDDEKGVFLVIAEDPATGLTEVDCMSHRSTRKRTRVCARFDTEAMRANLKTQSGVLHPDDIAKSLSYLSVAYERRKCPMCAATDAGECGCVLPFKRPSHPLDFRNERRNMSLHTGRYEGGSTVRLFNAMQPFVVTNLSTKSIIKGSVDKNIIIRMNKFAVQHSMSKLAVNPFAMMMPGGVPGLPLGSEHDSSGILQEFCGIPDVSMWDVFPSKTSSGGGAVTMNSSGLPGISNGESPVSMSTPGSAIDGESRDYLKEFVDTNTNGKKARDGMSGVTAPTKTILKQGSSGESAGSPMDVKEFKAELRRQRNREAAAKSNKKRKKRNEELRRLLTEASRRAAELREVEKRLREENVKLRSLANKHKVKISSHLTHIQISNP